MAVRVSAIVAASDNLCIGQDNDLPWHIPEDLKHFKTVTMGKPIVMGRKTFESIVTRLGKPLPGRDNIVVSRSNFEAEGVVVCSSIESAIEAAKELAADKGFDEIFIGGGAQIYEAALPHTDRIYLTRVHMVVNGDAFFPVLPQGEWQETSSETHEGDPAYSFQVFERRY